ncbi:MAG: hypothetical protein LBU88_04555 [Treponema sp.]|jgi:hypothetical protein|nr:hypothetical protein [Treponema sp.]
MMMKKKNFKVFTVLAVLLAISLGITACPETPVPESGYGYAKISIGGTNLARTILPDANEVDGNILSYKLTFTATDGYAVYAGYDTNLVVVKVDRADVGDPIPLVPGTYDLEVIAYLDEVADGQLLPVAMGEEEIVIDEGASTNTQITLSAYSPGSEAGEGSYSWILDFSGITADDFEAEMVITGGAGPITVDLHDDNDPLNSFAAGIATGATDLDADYYNVEFTITITDSNWVANKDEVSSASITFSQALWVYLSLESKFAFTFTDASFGPQKVTFKYLDGTPSTADLVTYTSLGGTVASGNMPSEYVKYQTYNLRTPPEGFTFDGWWTIDDSVNGGIPAAGYDPANPVDWGTEFTGGAAGTQVWGNITVYARWIKDGEYESPGFLFDEGSLGGKAIKVESTLDATTANVAKNSRITIANTVDTAVLSIINDTDYSSIEWSYTVAGTLVTVSGDTLNVLTTGGVAANSFIKGFEYIISVNATEDVSGEDQSFLFTLNLE